MIARLSTHLGNRMMINTYLLIIVRVIAAGFGFLFWAIVARMLETEAVGLASGAVASTVLLAGLAQLGMGYGIVRHFSQARDGNALISIALILTSLVAILIACLFLIGLPLLAPELLLLRSDLTAVLLFVALVISTTLSQLLNWIFLAVRQLSWSLAKNVIQAILAIGILLTLRGMDTYLSVVFAYTFATFGSTVVALFWFMPKAIPSFRLQPTWDPSIRNSFARFSFVNYVTDQFQRGPDSLMPLIIIQMLGPISSAYFYIAWLMGRSITGWANSIAESFFAEGSNDKKQAAIYSRTTMKNGIGIAFLMAIGMSVIGRLVLLLYGMDYLQQGGTLLALISFSAIPGVILATCINWCRIHDYLGAIFWITLVSVSLGLLTAYQGAQFGGLNGTGLGWLIGQTGAVIIIFIWWFFSKTRLSRQVSPKVES